MDTPSICGAIMVKQEAHIIRRCLQSLSVVCDEFIILDTGSTDDTLAVAEAWGEETGIPVKTASTEWVDFGVCRTELLKLCRLGSDCELVLMPDADWTLAINPDDNGLEQIDLTTANGWNVMIADGPLRWPLPKLTSNTHPWEYRGSVHEHLHSDEDGIVASAVPGIYFEHHRDSGTRNYRMPQDLELLEGKEDPRSVFYRAQTLMGMGRHQEALDTYKVRAEMIDTWEEEIYWSYYQMGLCAKALGRPQEAVGWMLKAWDTRPSRIESLCAACEIWRQEGNHHLAHMMASFAAATPETSDILFVEKWRWDWGARFELYIAQWWMGAKEDAIAGWRELIARDDLDPNFRSAVEYNLKNCTLPDNVPAG